MKVTNFCVILLLYKGACVKYINIILLLLVFQSLYIYPQMDLGRIYLGISDDNQNIVRLDYDRDIQDVYSGINSYSDTNSYVAFYWDENYQNYRKGDPNGILIYKLGNTGYPANLIVGRFDYEGKQKIYFSKNDNYLLHHCVYGDNIDGVYDGSLNGTITVVSLLQRKKGFDLSGTKVFWITDTEFVYSGISESTEKYIIRFIDINGMYMNLYESDSRIGLEVNNSMDLIINGENIINYKDYYGVEKSINIKDELSYIESGSYLDASDEDSGSTQENNYTYYDDEESHEHGAYGADVFFEYDWPKYGLANDSRIRIREEPNLGGEHIGYLDKNDYVEILAETINEMRIGDMCSIWYKIRTMEGVYGWVYGYFIAFYEATL